MLLQVHDGLHGLRLLLHDDDERHACLLLLLIVGLEAGHNRAYL
jgi:hypothetical protein